jgi:hypothetical protein
MTNNEIAKKILDVAASQIGVKEVRQNDSPQIKIYLKSVGLYEPNPWCMAYAYWCVNQIGLKNPLQAVGHCMTQYRATPKKYISKTPKVGYLAIQKHANDRGHTFFVEAVNGINLTTIEGNTNNDGSRNGTTCMRLNRRKTTDSLTIGYIMLPEWIAELNGFNEAKKKELI